ncbi:hypothetical protein R3Q06_30445 [Rhodococcus erythropolis]|uniref:flavin reductase family protein n=1 Tax=Rhodococcus erythropolis TaxID=1833 RepID=UPI002949E53B|nr:hypothetical protein [Rhodococcus erythropolis]MDV6277817.1 hypothetical protein [Rhodococcus erythropolis]
MTTSMSPPRTRTGVDHIREGHTTHAESERILTLFQKTEAADNVVILQLRDPAGDDLPAWTPGAHIDLQLEPGVVRRYSQHLAERFGEKVELHPQDIAGSIDFPSLLAKPQPDTLVYCCGPAPLLDAVTAHCSQWGSGSLPLERFVAQEFDEPVVAGDFEVELAQTGTTVTLTPDKSILQAVTAAGAQVLSSCEVGTCGT